MTESGHKRSIQDRAPNDGLVVNTCQFSELCAGLAAIDRWSSKSFFVRERRLCRRPCTVLPFSDALQVARIRRSREDRSHAHPARADSERLRTPTYAGHTKETGDRLEAFDPLQHMLVSSNLDTRVC